MILYRQANGKGNVNSLVQIANGVCCPDSGDVCQFTASVTKATVGAITAFSVKDKDGVTVRLKYSDCYKFIYIVRETYETTHIQCPNTHQHND